MDYLIAIFGFLATCVALFGTTYDRKRGRLLRGITPVGYATLVVAIGTLFAGFIKVQRDKTERSRTRKPQLSTYSAAPSK